jgi:TPR repeat protein
MNTLLMLTLSALAARIALQRPARAMASDEESPNPLQEAAEAGDLEAMYRLGWALEHGQGLPADPLEAASWYRRAADEGHDQAAAGLERVLASDDHRDAMFFVEDREAYDHDLSMIDPARLPGLMRVRSYVGADPDEARFKVDAATLLEGLKARNPDQIERIAALYASELLKPRDPGVKARWFRRAAVRGKIPSMSSYAFCHLTNEADTPQDFKVALRWLKKSAAGGFVPAKYGLWVLHGKSPDLVPLDEAIASLREAAEAENALSQFTYGQLLKNGLVVPRDEELGRSYIKRAYKNGYSTVKRTTRKYHPGAQTGSPESDSPETGAPAPPTPKPRSPTTGSARNAKGPKRKKRR